MTSGNFRTGKGKKKKLPSLSRFKYYDNWSKAWEKAYEQLLKAEKKLAQRKAKLEKMRK